MKTVELIKTLSDIHEEPTADGIPELRCLIYVD